MGLIAGPLVRGGGFVTAAFASPSGDLLAVASTFPLLTQPPARAAYAGHSLRHRLALYKRGRADPLAAYDELPLPVTAVAFHPTEEVIAIGAGAYDGGFFFDGDLVVWQWRTGRSMRPQGRVPQVETCRFREDGCTLDLLVRPPDEEFDLESDSFSTLYSQRVVLAQSDLLEPVELDETIDASTRLTDDAARAQGFDVRGYDPDAALTVAAEWTETPRQRSRGSIFDIAWLHHDLAVVHEDCLLEILARDGQPLASHTGEGHGVEIVRTSPPHVHVAVGLRAKIGEPYAPRARLFALGSGTLRLAGEFEGTFTFAGSGDGRIVGRADRAGLRQKASLDLLIHAGTGQAKSADLGHYDVFNHFLGIDGAPRQFILQGDPPTRHENKKLCVVEPDGAVRPLWPLLEADGAPASHAMECCGAYVWDDAGEGAVIAGIHHNPNPSGGAKGFFYRKSLRDGRTLWRHGVGAAATAIAFLPEANLIAAAFLDETLLVVDATDGNPRFRSKTTAHGLRTLITALEGKGRELAVGTIDGHIALLEVDDLLALAADASSYDLST